jgi:hypothetical protein
MDEAKISRLLKEFSTTPPGENREDLAHEVAHLLGQYGQDCLAEMRWHNAYRIARGWPLREKLLSSPLYPIDAMCRLGLVYRYGEKVALTPLGVEVCMFALL